MSSPPPPPSTARHDHKTITFTVDAEPLTSDQHTLTPREILALAGLDPADFYLVRVHGRDQESFKDAADEPIRVHEHDVFISVAVGPTPVSFWEP